jgi:transcription elongation factor Elf1
VTTPHTPCAAATCDRTLLDTELATGQVLCSPCVDRIGVWLRELPLQITVLEGSRQRETTGARAGGRTVYRTAPLPGRADVLNLLGPAAWTDQTIDPHGDARADQHGQLPIAGVLIAWVRLITEERRWNPPVSLAPDDLALWLAQPKPLAWASRRPWAGDMRDELDALMRTVRDTTRLRPRRRAVPQPCPRCDSLTLVETDHQLYTECGTCSSMYTREELALAARLHPSNLEAGAA